MLLLGVSVVIFIIQILTLRPPVGIGEPYWIAKHLAAGEGFIYPYPFDSAWLPTCYIPPLYVWFHAAIIGIGGGLVVTQIAGLIFFHAANFFFYKFFQRITTKTIAFIGFCGLACYVPLWLISQKPDPDGLNLLLIALTILTLDRIISKQKISSMWNWVTLGILFGLQILVRPDILMGIVLFGLWLLFYSGKYWLRNGIRFCFSVAIALAMVLPWTIRNYNTFHSFVLVSSNSGFNFFIGNNPIATGEFQQGVSNAESQRMDTARTEFYRVHTSPVERDSYLFKVGKDWVLEHPGDALILGMKKCYYHWWQREYAGGSIAASAWMVTGYKFISIFLLTFGFIGLFSLRSKSSRALLMTLFLYSTLISVIFFTQSRHRAIKIDPYLVTLSIIGVGATLKKIKRNESKQ
ncbi:MAG: glycosyltransferase family 39 protein [bacterium]